MCATIFDRIGALSLPKALQTQSPNNPYPEDYYIVAWKGGDNNIADLITGRRSSDWHPLAAGPWHHCFRECIETASAMPSGCLKAAFAKTPETFILKCRHALKDAPHFNRADAMAVAGFQIKDATIVFTEYDRKENSPMDYWRSEVLRRRQRAAESRRKHLLGEVEAWPFNHHDPDDLAAFISLLPPDRLSPLWRHLSIAGT